MQRLAAMMAKLGKTRIRVRRPPRQIKAKRKHFSRTKLVFRGRGVRVIHWRGRQQMRPKNRNQYTSPTRFTLLITADGRRRLYAPQVPRRSIHDPDHAILPQVASWSVDEEPKFVETEIA